MRKCMVLAATVAITATSSLAQEGYPGPNAVTVVMMAFDIHPNGGYEVLDEARGPSAADRSTRCAWRHI
jgi:hypothetical protein